jgi:hypothetical protein
MRKALIYPELVHVPASGSWPNTPTIWHKTPSELNAAQPSSHPNLRLRSQRRARAIMMATGEQIAVATVIAFVKLTMTIFIGNVETDV